MQIKRDKVWSLGRDSVYLPNSLADEMPDRFFQKDGLALHASCPRNTLEFLLSSGKGKHVTRRMHEQVHQLHAVLVQACPPNQPRQQGPHQETSSRITPWQRE